MAASATGGRGYIRPGAGLQSLSGGSDCPIQAGENRGAWRGGTRVGNACNNSLRFQARIICSCFVLSADLTSCGCRI
jgi:hypothetical protein